jgi:hypothetical protein
MDAAMDDEAAREPYDVVRGEPRWPMVAAVLAASVLTTLRPAELRIMPAWVLPVVEVTLLVVLVVRDPGRIDRRSRTLRYVSICVVAILVVDALVATGHLVVVLVRGGHATESAEALLVAGAVVWVSNIIVFALLYWELDSGGAAARAHGLPSTPDIAFPQQLNPELAPPGWRPQFHDHLYLGLTSATAFSPTDAMPLAGWAKLAMSVESLISLTVLGLVIARAVNVLT